MTLMLWIFSECWGSQHEFATNGDSGLPDWRTAEGIPGTPREGRRAGNRRRRRAMSMALIGGALLSAAGLPESAMRGEMS